MLLLNKVVEAKVVLANRALVVFQIYSKTFLGPLVKMAKEKAEVMIFAMMLQLI
jgi:hypothetical protein